MNDKEGYNGNLQRIITMVASGVLVVLLTAMWGTLWSQVKENTALLAARGERLTSIEERLRAVEASNHEQDRKLNEAYEYMLGQRARTERR